MADDIQPRIVPNGAQRELARRRGLDRQRLADAVASPLPDMGRGAVNRGQRGYENDPDDDETLYQDEGVGRDETAGGGETDSPITGGIAPEGGVTGDSGRSAGELSDDKDNGAGAQDVGPMDDGDATSPTARAGANVALKAIETAQPEAKVFIEGAKALGIDVEGAVAKRLEYSPLGLVAGAMAGDVKKQFILVLSITGAALLMILTFSLFIGGMRYVACTGFSGIILNFTTDGLCDTLPKENPTTNVNSEGQVK